MIDNMRKFADIQIYSFLLESDKMAICFLAGVIKNFGESI